MCYLSYELSLYAPEADHQPFTAETTTRLNPRFAESVETRFSSVKLLTLSKNIVFNNSVRACHRETVLS